MSTMPTTKRPFALMAEFRSSRELIAAIREARSAGYTQLEAYTPYPIEEVWEELGHHRSWLPLIVLIAGVFGACFGYFMQYWVSVMNFRFSQSIFWKRSIWSRKSMIRLPTDVITRTIWNQPSA